MRCTGSAAAAGGSRPVVYLHIGSPKSGTTFLQQVMWRNAHVLAAQGLLLPGDSFLAHDRAMRDLLQIPRVPSDPAPPYDGEWAALCAQILRKNPPRAIISHELLYAGDETRLKVAFDCLAPAEIHVIYTMRDLGRLLPSEWQENVKHRSTEPYDAWLRDVIDVERPGEIGRWFWSAHDAVEILRRWSSLVPADRIHVVTVPQSGAPSDLLWNRFASLLGIDPASVDTEGVRANPSLGTVATELVRRVNIALGPREMAEWQYVTTFRDVLAQEVLPGCGAPGRTALPAHRLAWTRARARVLIEGLRAAGYDVIGDLGELIPVSSAARGGRQPSDVTETELLAAAVDGIIGLLDHVTALRGEVSRAEADILRKPFYKIIAARLSQHYALIMRLRVAYWRRVERRRRRAARLA